MRTAQDPSRAPGPVANVIASEVHLHPRAIDAGVEGLAAGSQTGAVLAKVRDVAPTYNVVRAWWMLGPRKR